MKYFLNFTLIRPEVKEVESIAMLKWFIKQFPDGVTSKQFRTFFPAINTGQHLSDMVFRTLDTDSSGMIGFLELILALDLVGATK